MMQTRSLRSKPWRKQLPICALVRWGVGSISGGKVSFARRLVVRLISVCLMIACGLAPPALAAGDEFTLRGADLVINVDTRWTGNVHGGYYPIRIRALNRGQPRNLTFRFDSRSGDAQRIPVVERTIGVEQNATVQFTLAVPMVGSGRYGFLSVHHGGGKPIETGSPISLPVFVQGSASLPSLLVISPDHVDCTEFEQAVSATTAKAHSSSGLGFGRGTYSPSADDQQVIPPAMLPERWIDYSGLDLVALSLQTLSKIPNAARAAILKWIECGGTLIVYDVGEPAGESKELARIIGFAQHNFVAAKWVKANPKGRRKITVVDEEEELLRRHSGFVGNAEAVEAEAEPDPPTFVWSGGANTFVRRNLMLGSVYAFIDNPFPGSPHDWAWFLKSVGPKRHSWTQRNGITARIGSGDFLEFLIPGVKGVPVLASLMLMTLFTLVIGPVNYFLLRRRKQLFLLVVTIPVIALLTSVMLFSYSAIAHGFGIKSRARSLTILDQKSRSAVAMSRLALYAGLAPSGGLRFSPETAVFTIWPVGSGFESGRVDWTETQALQSGWLRSRTRTQFHTMTNRDERGRLEIGSPSGESMSVSNGLEWDIEALVVADSAGRLYSGDKLLPAGASTKLRLIKESDHPRVVQMLTRYPLQVPDGISEGQNTIFDFGPSMRHMYRSSNSAARFSDNLMERTIRGLYDRKANRLTVQPRSYLAVMQENPDVETGLERTDEEVSYHVLV
jgi:hypothetical protein